MSHLVDIYLQPGKVFAELKQKPAFWLPLLLIAVSSALVVVLYYMRVDPDFALDQLVRASAGDMSAAEVEQMRSVMPDAQRMGWFGAISALVGSLAVTAIFALYFMLAGKVAGAAVSFRHGLSLVSWSSMPMLLGTIVVLVGVLTMEPRTTFESLGLLNVDPLLVQLPPDHKWNVVAQAFSLLNFWTWFLLALGWRTWTRSGWVASILVAVLPSLVVFGLMALFA